jgi:hypothetical protein
LRRSGEAGTASLLYEDLFLFRTVRATFRVGTAERLSFLTLLPGFFAERAFPDIVTNHFDLENESGTRRIAPYRLIVFQVGHDSEHHSMSFAERPLLRDCSTV